MPTVAQLLNQRPSDGLSAFTGKVTSRDYAKRLVVVDGIETQWCGLSPGANFPEVNCFVLVLSTPFGNFTLGKIGEPVTDKEDNDGSEDPQS